MCSYFGHSSLYHFPKLLICSNCEEATRLYLTCLNEAQFFGRVANWLMISREKEKKPHLQFSPTGKEHFLVPPTKHVDMLFIGPKALELSSNLLSFS